MVCLVERSRPGDKNEAVSGHLKWRYGAEGDQGALLQLSREGVDMVGKTVRESRYTESSALSYVFEF